MANISKMLGSGTGVITPPAEGPPGMALITSVDPAPRVNRAYRNRVGRYGRKIINAQCSRTAAGYGSQSGSQAIVDLQGAGLDIGRAGVAQGAGYRQNCRWWFWSGRRCPCKEAETKPASAS